MLWWYLVSVLMQELGRVVVSRVGLVQDPPVPGPVLIRHQLGPVVVSQVGLVVEMHQLLLPPV